MYKVICANFFLYFQVHYRFETNGAFGIDQAYVRFTFSDITSSSVTQTFSTSFSSVGGITKILLKQAIFYILLIGRWNY